LGLAYQKGLGVKKNLAQAAKFFGLAADQGHFSAQLNLSKAYYYDQGMEKDLINSV
jgi:TPR repeat protein